MYFTEDTTGERYYRIGNADGKYWVFPQKHLRTGLALYQPSGSKGKWLKRALPLLNDACRISHTNLAALPGMKKLLRMEVKRGRLHEDLHATLTRCFGRDLEFAIFEGTPSVHKKATIQVSRGTNILGYSKVTNSKEIYRLFENEQQVLNSLHTAGIKGIPEIKYCGHLSDGTSVLVQTTQKDDKSVVVHQWSVVHEAFLHTMQALTSIRMLWDETDYCHSITALQQHIDWLPTIYREKVKSCIDEVFSKYRGTEVEYSAYHADFTPWNMFFDPTTGIFVFDWEYASLSYPPMMDKCHFLTQTGIFEQNLSPKEIKQKVENETGKELYHLYLLDIIARYTLREGRPIDKPEGVLFNALEAID